MVNPLILISMEKKNAENPYVGPIEPEKQLTKNGT